MSVTRKVSNIKELSKTLAGANGLVAKVGWFEGARYEDGTPVAYVASIHEFGYQPGGIPPHPFMRPTVANRRVEWANLGKSGAKAVLLGDTTMKQVMIGIGLAAQGDIQKTISTIKEPPLKPATVAARLRKLSKGKSVGGKDKPLIDSSNLITTLTSTVE